MIDIEILFGGKKEILPFPSSWNEFSKKELKTIARFLEVGAKEQLLLSILKGRIRHLNVTIENIAEDDLIDLLPIADQWLSKIDLTENPFPFIKGNAAPTSFDMLTVGEYEIGDACFTDYISQSEGERSLDPLRQLVGHIWRPENQDGLRCSCENYQPRQSFLRSIPESTLHLIYLWWAGSRQELLDLFPMVFNSDGDEESDSPGLGITTLIHAAAGERNGTRQHIRWTNTIKEFLYDCQLQQEAAEKLERELKAKK